MAFFHHMTLILKMKQNKKCAMIDFVNEVNQEILSII